MGGQTKPGPGWHCQAVVCADAMHRFRCSGTLFRPLPSLPTTRVFISCWALGVPRGQDQGCSGPREDSGYKQALAL